MGSGWVRRQIKGFLLLVGLTMALMDACGILVLDFLFHSPPPPKSQNVEGYFEMIELVEKGTCSPTTLAGPIFRQSTCISQTEGKSGFCKNTMPLASCSRVPGGYWEKARDMSIDQITALL